MYFLVGSARRPPRTFPLLYLLAPEFAETLAIVPVRDTFGIEVPKERCVRKLPASSRPIKRPVHLRGSRRLAVVCSDQARGCVEGEGSSGLGRDGYI